MIDVQFDTVLLSPATANAVKVVSTEHVVAHGSRDLSVLGIVGYATVLIFQAVLLTCLLSFRLLVIFDKHRDDNFTAPENSSENQDRLKGIYDRGKVIAFHGNHPNIRLSPGSDNPPLLVNSLNVSHLKTLPPISMSENPTHCPKVPRSIAVPRNNPLTGTNG